jgi:hypothetical protein
VFPENTVSVFINHSTFSPATYYNDGLDHPLQPIILKISSCKYLHQDNITYNLTAATTTTIEYAYQQAAVHQDRIIYNLLENSSASVRTIFPLNPSNQ